MKKGLVLLLLLSSLYCIAQRWEAEMMTGLTGYSGDLTQKLFAPRSVGAATAFNIRYQLNYTVSVRAGILSGSIAGNDKYNADAELKKRNLNFRSNIFETNLALEVNLLEPEYFFFYPYLFGGIGIYHFDPYTYNKTAQRVYLQPLGTEGQGMAAYPDRKPYSLTQFCLPFGGGFKFNLSKRLDLAWELSGRYLFTDYLDDVSQTYVNMQAISASARPEAAEMACRRQDNFVPREGDPRGNPKVKDWYYVSGFKLAVRLGGSR